MHISLPELNGITCHFFLFWTSLLYTGISPMRNSDHFPLETPTVTVTQPNLWCLLGLLFSQCAKLYFNDRIFNMCMWYFCMCLHMAGGVRGGKVGVEEPWFTVGKSPKVYMQSLAQNSHPSKWWPRSVIFIHGLQEWVHSLWATDSPLMQIKLSAESPCSLQADMWIPFWTCEPLQDSLQMRFDASLSLSY